MIFDAILLVICFMAFHSVQIYVPQQVLWIRIRSDPNLLAVAGSGYGSIKILSGSGQLRIWNEFEIKVLWKADKSWQFLNKNAQIKNINSFFLIPFTVQIISPHKLQPNTLTYKTEIQR